MSGRRSISNSFTVITVDDPVSVVAQYAPNANPSAGQIHDTWQDGDLYMRTRSTDSNVWSDWHRIVGEGGDETDYTFAISQHKTTSSATTAPRDISSSDWQDAPLAVTSSKPYLWSRVQKKVWNDALQDYVIDSTRYIRLTGEDGDDAPVAFATPDKISVPCDNNGNVKAEMVKSVTFSMKVGTHAASVTAVSRQSAPSGVTVTGVATNAVTITISTSATSSGISNGVVLNVTGSYNGKSYTAQVTVALIGSDEGGKGEKGDTGTGGTFYEVVPTIESVRIPADSTDTTLSSTPTASFNKIVGSTRSSESLYWSLYWKSGTQLTRYNSGGATSSINLPTTYSAGNDALVIFCYSTSSFSTTTFLAKKEIIILKNGNTGAKGDKGDTGGKGDKGDKGDTGNAGTSAMYIHLKGTGQNNNQTALCEAFNGTTLDSRSITSRGLTLIKILRSDLSISSIMTYDVYGETVGYGESACANLAAAINIITSDYFVCLVSWDAVRWTQELIDALGNFGSIGLNDTTAYRVPFAFIGYKGLPKGQAVQVQSGMGTTDAPAEITVYVKDGAIAVSKEPTVGRVGGRFYYNAGEYSYTSDVSFYVNDKEAPYFLYNNDYWVFEPNASSTTYYSMADMGYPSSHDSNWHLMVYNKQQFFMSEVMFARYAHLGSFIFNGDWQLSTNGEIDGTTYNNSANIGGTVITSSGTSSFSIKGYTLFDQEHPLGETIVVTSGDSTDKVVIGNQENTKTIATVYLRSDCVYKFKCKGRRYSNSYDVYVRLRSTNGSNGTWNAVHYPSTSDYESSTFTFRPQTSGYFYLEMYQPTLPSSIEITAGGETNAWSLTRVLFMPMLALDGMTGRTYQNDAFVRGQMSTLNGMVVVKEDNQTIGSGWINITDRGLFCRNDKDNSNNEVIAAIGVHKESQQSSVYEKGFVNLITRAKNSSNYEYATISGAGAYFTRHEIIGGVDETTQTHVSYSYVDTNEVRTNKIIGKGYESGYGSLPVAMPQNVVLKSNVNLPANPESGMVIFAPNCKSVKASHYVYKSDSSTLRYEDSTSSSGHEFNEQRPRIFVGFYYSGEFRWKEYDCA